MTAPIDEAETTPKALADRLDMICPWEQDPGEVSDELTAIAAALRALAQPAPAGRDPALWGALVRLACRAEGSGPEAQGMDPRTPEGRQAWQALLAACAWIYAQAFEASGTQTEAPCGIAGDPDAG